MPDPFLEILKFASPSVALMFFLWKIVVPWSDFFLNSRGGGRLAARVTKIETNDLHECKETSDEFIRFKVEVRNKFDGLEDKVGSVSDRVARIEGRMNGSFK